MKYLSIFIISIFAFLPIYADYNTELINEFINSPSLEEINKIQDPKTRVCERVFLEAYMRREFTYRENLLCSDIFERKIEAQLMYMRYVMGFRGIY